MSAPADTAEDQRSLPPRAHQAAAQRNGSAAERVCERITLLDVAGGDDEMGHERRPAALGVTRNLAAALEVERVERGSAMRRLARRDRLDR